jgi:uncharacterized protein (TIGR02145 family)
MKTYGSTPALGAGTYKTVEIGEQVWMAENLSYTVHGNVFDNGDIYDGNACYEDDPDNCVKYGRLYDWVTAMALPSSCYSDVCESQINTPHKGICPTGWHIPSSGDWDVLMEYIQTANGSTYTSGGAASIAGKHLKAMEDWNGADTYGFAALPGGSGRLSQVSKGQAIYAYSNISDFGFWWSTLERNGSYASYAYHRQMQKSNNSITNERISWNSNGKTDLYSVRCVKDTP